MSVLNLALQKLVRIAVWLFADRGTGRGAEAGIRADLEQRRPTSTSEELDAVVQAAREGRRLRAYLTERIRRYQERRGLPGGQYGYLPDEPWGDFRPVRSAVVQRVVRGDTVSVEVLIRAHTAGGRPTTRTERYNVGYDTTLEQIRQYAMRTIRYPGRGGPGGGYLDLVADSVTLIGAAWLPVPVPTHTFP